MASNFNKIRKGINLEPVTGSTVTVEGDIAYNNTSNQLEVRGDSATESVTTDSNSQTVSNKTLNNTNTVTIKDANLTIQDDGDATKQAKFQASGITAGQTRTLTIPDASTTIVGTDATQTLTNKTISGSTNTITNVSLTTGVTGTLPIDNGGTGQTTQTAAFDGLAPTTTKGDLIVRNSSNNVRLGIGSDNQVLVADSAQASGVKWTTLQQGAKNYITYSNFENNATTGWSLGTGSVDSTTKFLTSTTFGSGASGNLSISIVSSGQLAGTYSLSYASSAATTAGNFLASDAFSIDLEDQAKPMSFKFFYKAQTNPSNGNWSGTTSNSFGVAIYDVTNGTLIQPAGCFNFVQSSGVGICQGNFQTSSSGSSYRLIIYNANATAGAITLYFDDFYVGPQSVAYGVPATDWQSYTPTGSWTTNTTYAARWRRVGDQMQVQARLDLAGAPGGTAALTEISLPSGYTIDTTKLPSTTSGNTRVGYGIAEIVNQYPLLVVYFSTTSVRPIAYNYGGDGAGTDVVTAGITSTAPATFGSGDWVSVEFEVPIVGWSSNTQMSNDTDTRVVALFANGQPTGTLNSSANTTIFGTVVNDTHGAYNSSTGIYTVPVSGFYDISSGVRLNGTYAAGNTTTINIYKNGSQFKGNILTVDGTAGSRTVQVSANAIYCNAGDTLNIATATDITSPTYNSNTGFSFLSISRRSGPSVIAASESVNLRYVSTSGQTIEAAGGGEIIIYETKSYDSHGSTYNTSTGVWTCPVSGKWRINAKVSFASAVWTTGNYSELAIRKNSSIVSDMYFYPVGTTQEAYTTVSDTLSLVTGDTIDIFYDHNRSGGNITLGTGVGNCVLTIEKVGN